MGAHGIGEFLCDYPEAPPTPGETLVHWKCRACRIGWAAAVLRGVPPSVPEYSLERARSCHEAHGEPWMAEAIHALELHMMQGVS